MGTDSASSSDRFEVWLNTPAGPVTTTVEVPTGFVPVTAIVSAVRQVGEQAQALESEKALASGKTVSCRKGCAACCRMLVPVSAPEAFALNDMIHALPEPHRRATLGRIAEARARLEQAGLWERLNEVAETGRQLSDDEIEPVNRDYYALRMPCPFLEDEVCTIHEHRPSACRELLVTSPAELCQDMALNPVQTIPVPVRMSTILGMLWSELSGGPTRLIPLPLVLAWAERHQSENGVSWKAKDLLDRAFEKVYRFLSPKFAGRQTPAPESKQVPE